MNRRPTLLAAIALTAVAALSLSACGSDDSSKKKDNDKIAGADTGDEKSASPSASASDSAKRPTIKLPSDLTMKFEGEKTGNSVKDAVLADSAERMRGVNAAIAGTDPKQEALGFYNSGKALEAALTWVGKFKDAKLGITGSIRYYNRTVTLDGSKVASVVFCADESKGYAKNLKTGKPQVTTPSDEDFILYNTRLEKNRDGVWQTTRIVSTAGAKQCLNK
ncbi:hypothetical protein [Streptomyces sporangiiformans]|uniref:Lipoprotein n=1 Tax=Streptomyces sporangiiformans TaxID=2315329 RepID=A0A505D935_9ACTN|nr:hypothetical protein [Streptomyces sporangiiformans]TPQ20224.1 hypothetical protein FGD71_021395 [Streptomyces sporangiiformans]